MVTILDAGGTDESASFLRGGEAFVSYSFQIVSRAHLTSWSIIPGYPSAVNAARARCWPAICIYRKVRSEWSHASRSPYIFMYRGDFIFHPISHLCLNCIYCIYSYVVFGIDTMKVCVPTVFHVCSEILRECIRLGMYFRTKFLLIYFDIYPSWCNVTHFISFSKLLYMFWVVTPPIIRSTYNFIYSIWHLSNLNCYLSQIAAGSSYDLTSARCCRYS